MSGKRFSDGLSALRVPDPEGVVVTPRDDARSVGTPSHALDIAGMSGKRFSDGLSALRVPDPEVLSSLPETIRVPSGLQATLKIDIGMSGKRFSDGLSGLGVPEPEGLVPTPRDDARSVGTPSHAQDTSGMSGKRFSDGLSALRVPDPEGVVVTPRDDAGSVGTPSHAVKLGMSGKRFSDGLSALCVPEPEGLVVNSRDDARSVGTPSHAQDMKLGMSGKRFSDGLSALRVPEPERVVSLPETIRVPSGLQATLLTKSECPVRGSPMACPLCASQSRRVLSSLPETMRVPSGLQATLKTTIGMSGKRFSDGLSALRVPDPEGVVGTPRDDARPVGTPSHAQDISECPVRGSPMVCPLCASQSRRGRSHSPRRFAFRRDSKPHWLIGMSGKRFSDGLSALRVPDSERHVVHSPRHDSRSVGTPSHARDA